MKTLILSPVRLSVILAIALCCLQNPLFAQRINTATVGTSSATYSSINGLPGTVTLSTFGSSVYYRTVSMSLPFAFTYDNIFHASGSTIYVRQGHISLNASSSPDPTYQTYIGNSSYANIIAPLMGLQVSAPDGSSRWLYIVTGTAPNRVLTIEWYKWGDYPSQSLGNTSYQVRLYETTNNIEFLYKDFNFTMNNSSYSSYKKGTGLNGSTSPTFISVPLQTGTIVTPSKNYLIYYYIPPNAQLGLNLTNPKSINFGSVITGNESVNTITVTNVGDDSRGPSKLSIKNVTLTGDPDFSIVSAPLSSDSIATGDSRTISFKFRPTGDGARSATLTVVSNGMDSGTQSVAIQGIGLAPLISVDTNIIFKNTRTSMARSRDARIVITSTNIPTLHITGFEFIGEDAGEYSVSRYPSSMDIAGGTSDTVYIRYTPTKEGRHVATMNILNNSINNPILPITLWGTGTLPHIIVTPSTIHFDSVGIGENICQEVTISNPGTDTLLITQNIMTSNDGDFTYTGLVGTDTIIPPDKSKTLNICFKPKQMGSRIARVQLSTNIPKTFEPVTRDTAGSIAISITGTGVPYGLLSQSLNTGVSFNDSTIIGTTICLWDTIRNNGDADLTISSVSITGANAADYTLSGIKTPFIIKAHSSVIAQICGTPSAAGLRNASLAITGTSNGKSLTSTSALNVFGWTVCATADPSSLFKDKLVLDGTVDTETVTITNCGDVPTSYTASLPNGTVYSIISPATTAVVAPKGTASFMVTFAPTTVGPLPATLTVTPSTPELAAITIPMNGVSGCASAVGNTPTIPQTGADGHASFTVTIDNATGTYAWTAGAPVITPNDGVFTVTSALVPDAPAGGQTTLTMDFHPTQINTPYSAQLTFPNASPACAPPVVVVLSQTSTSASVDTRGEANGFKLGQNHPNPFTVNSVFTFTTPTEAAVRLTVSDLTGKVIKIISDGRVSAGEHSVTLEANDFASGTYVLTLQSGTTTLAKTFVVTK